MTCYSQYTTDELRDHLIAGMTDPELFSEILQRFLDLSQKDSSAIRELKEELDKAHAKITELEELLCQ